MYAFTDAAWILGWVAEGLVKSTLILTVAWVVTACLLRSSSASLRHWIWITALLSLLAMPALAPLLPAWEVPWLRAPMEQLQSVSGTDVQTRVYRTSRAASHVDEAPGGEAGPAHLSAPAAATPVAWDEVVPLPGWLVLGWLAGAVVFVLRPVLGMAYVARLTRQARRNGGTVAGGEMVRLVEAQGLMRRVAVVRSERVAIPVTWGIWRPVILLPVASSTWDGAQVRSVLLHELAHIRRWDYPLYLLAQVARACYWFNPLAWVAVRRVQAEQEQACDDWVLQAGMPSSDYAAHLLAVARSYRQPGALASGSVGMARPSALKGRIQAILSSRTNRRPLSLPVGTYVTALMGVLVVPIAMVPGPNAAYTSVQRLVRTLEQGDVAARQQAALRLGGLDDPRAVEALITALHDAAEPVSVTARLALQRFDTPRARQALVRQRTAPPAAVEPAPPPEEEPVYVWLEAEHGMLNDPMQPLGTVEASGGGYVKVPHDWAHDEADRDGEHLELKKHGAVTFVFDIDQAGEYVIWGRTLAPATDENSFFVSIDGAPDVIWDTPDERLTTTRWVWDRVSAREHKEQPGVDPMIVHLEPGQHTIQVRNREEGTKLDRLLVTNDLDYQPTGHGALPTPTRYRNLWIEAEDGSLSEPLRVLDDGSAANGQYIEVDDGHNSTDQPPERGRALYRFTILEAGTYMLWGRLIAPDDTGDSFWVRVDGDQWVPWNGIWQEQQWHWVPVYHKEDVTQPMQFSLSAGAHSVEIAYREDGTKLDRLLITNDLAYEPDGTGEAAKPVEVIFRTD